MTMKISLIVPIYNEEKKIDTLLAQLRALPGSWEIILADGGSTDDTLQKAGLDFTLLSCPKGRANQMNFAASRAAGDVLWFVHCDSILPKNAYDQIRSAVENGAQWGCFHIGFDYHGPFKRVPEGPVVSREHLPQLEKIQEVLPSRRDEAHFR